MQQPGYAYIYFSNDNGQPLEVFFDDFTVTHSHSAIVQADDYYPFGMTFNSYRRELGKLNEYLYQGKERSEALGWDDFHARMYSPALGRFFGVDPQDQFASPFIGMGNNPVVMIDPDGEWAFLIPVAIGAVVNTVSNWQHISSADNFLQGLGRAAGYAGVGALQGASTLVGGPAGYALSGAVGGLGNGLMQGLSEDALMANIGVGAASGLLGGIAAQGAGQLIGDIASPLLDGLAKGAVGGAAGGFVGGGVASSLMGGSFWDGAWQGTKSGALTGGLVGAAVSSYSAAKAGFNPLTGQRTESWLAKNTLPTVEGKGTSEIRVRHHTNRQGLIGIKGTGQINPSRPYNDPGIHVEIPPFKKPSDVNLGQWGRGGYVEFSHPEHNIKIPQGILGSGNAGKIPTHVPLNIRNANPTYKYWGWWNWFR